MDRIASIAQIEFAVLFLRTCLYTSQFLPCPGYNLDSIKGISLASIRKSCSETIEALVPICNRLNPRGSLSRVQHLAFAGLSLLCQGRTNAYWEHLSSAVGVAQRIGLHEDSTARNSNLDELEKEIRRRVFCNLYVWDR